MHTRERRTAAPPPHYNNSKQRESLMNVRYLTATLIGSLVLAMPVLADTAKPATPEQTLIALEQKLTDSQQNNTADSVAALYDENIVQTNTDGSMSIGRAAVVAEAKKNKFTSATMADAKVAFFGDVAITTGTWTAKGTYGGKAFDSHGRWTDTWVKKAGGQWLLVAAHASYLPEKK